MPLTEWQKHEQDGYQAFYEGRYAEAEEHFKAALKEAEKSEPEDPLVARSLKNLALLYAVQRKYAEAEPLLKRSLAIWEKAQGPDGPNVASSLDSLAAFYLGQGKYAEAEPFLKRSLAIREKAQGPYGPDVARSREHYAALMHKMGRDAEAEGLEARAKAIRAKSTQNKPGK